jgi:hypothetical protein
MPIFRIPHLLILPKPNFKVKDSSITAKVIFTQGQQNSGSSEVGFNLPVPAPENLGNPD